MSGIRMRPGPLTVDEMAALSVAATERVRQAYLALGIDAQPTKSLATSALVVEHRAIRVRFYGEQIEDPEVEVSKLDVRSSPQGWIVFVHGDRIKGEGPSIHLPKGLRRLSELRLFELGTFLKLYAAKAI